MVSNFRRVHWDYFRGTSIKRDNFFAVTENLEGEVLCTRRKEGSFTRRTNLYLFASGTPAGRFAFQIVMVFAVSN